MTRHLEYAELLFQQHRWADCEKHLRQALAEEPEDAYATALLALCLSRQERHDDAVHFAEEAVRLGPDTAYCHWALARTLNGADQSAAAKGAALEAIRLDPDDPDFYGTLAAACMDLREWDEALQAADRGLSLEPDHVYCANLRTMILVQLGRRQEARETVDQALREEPDNPVSHANKGWALLHSGNPRAAMDHFREALRLNPDMEWARLGIIEALKARHLIYRVMLKYFLWMSRLSGRAQWVIILGLYVGARVLRGVGRSYPDLRVVTTPLLIGYAVFVYLTWVATPLFNLLLRLNPIGKYALTDAERTRANATGICLLVAALALVCGVIWDLGSAVLGGILSLVMVIPVSGTLGLPPGRSRSLMGLYTLGLGGVGVAALVTEMPLSGNLLMVFFLGVLGYSFVRNSVRG